MKTLPRALPEALGISPEAVLRFVQAVEEKQLGLHSFMLLRHGAVAAEGYWEPYKPEYNHMLFSLSKSFTSTAIGFAIGEGRLSLSDRLISFFPEKLASPPCENMRKMELRHLIGMCTGHRVEPSLSGEDWVENFLSSYVPDEPGSHFVYNTAATYMLSAVLQKVTGQTVRDYLEPRLFAPLGIEDIWWETCPKGINTGGFGLNVKTEDIAKFSLFLLQKGLWEGKQLINPAWIEEATARHIPNYGATPDWNSGYGYQFWRCQIEGVYRGDGAFGQYCVVMPQYDATFVSTSGSDDLQGILDQVWTWLVPGMDGKCAGSSADMKKKLASLTLPCPRGGASPETPVKSALYTLSDNPFGYRSIGYNADDGSWRIETDEGVFPVRPGYRKWVDGHAENAEDPVFASELRSRVFYETYASAYAWNGDTCTLVLYFTRTPSMQVLTLTPKDASLSVTIEPAHSFRAGKLHLYGVPSEDTAIR